MNNQMEERKGKFLIKNVGVVEEGIERWEGVRINACISYFIERECHR